MASVVELPRLSDTMEEGVVAKWLIAVGDKVKRGQIIAEIETDKATMEFESFDAGYVLELVAEEGEALPLGSPIAVFGKKDEDAQAALDAHKSASAAPAVSPSERPEPADVDAVEAAEPKAPQTTEAPDPQEATESDRRIPASPVARRLAREAGLALTQIEGSGPHGRIIKSDVEAAVRDGVVGPAANSGAGMAVASFSSEVDRFGRPYASRARRQEPLTQMRKTIVKRMTLSKQTVPHFYLTVDIDMQRAAELRKEYNAARKDEGVKISFNDLAIKAVALALHQHPECNASYTDEGFVLHGDIHVGVAVAVPGGLIVPVVRHAEQRSLPAISAEVRDLATRARDKRLRPEEMSGSTFSVSNLGMFGVQEFSAVINPGEGGILALGAVEDRAVVENGSLVVAKRMKATMSCDHRVIDGAVGAVWLQTVRRFLENPVLLF